MVGISSLNPYYTGSYSIRNQNYDLWSMLKSLNPYYTGSYSISWTVEVIKNILTNCLNPYYTGSYSISAQYINTDSILDVLILIILEVTL